MLVDWMAMCFRKSCMMVYDMFHEKGSQYIFHCYSKKIYVEIVTQAMVILNVGFHYAFVWTLFDKKVNVGRKHKQNYALCV